MRVSTSATATALLLFSTSAAALSAIPHLDDAARGPNYQRAIDHPSPESCALPSSGSNHQPCSSSSSYHGTSSRISSKQKSKTPPSSSSGKQKEKDTIPIHLEKSNEASSISLNKYNPRDPRSLRFQGGVFKSSTGRTGVSAYDLGIRPRKVLEFERRPFSGEGRGKGKGRMYAPGPVLTPSVGLNMASSNMGDPTRWNGDNGGRVPGITSEYMSPERQVWTTTPPRMHWRFVFIVSIAVPTFLTLSILLLIIQYLFFPNALDFSSPVGDGYIYIGLSSSLESAAAASGGWGPTLPFSNSRRTHDRSGSDGGSVGSTSFHGQTEGGGVGVVTGAEAGPSSQSVVMRRSPNPLRGKRKVGWGQGAVVELGETSVGAELGSGSALREDGLAMGSGERVSPSHLGSSSAGHMGSPSSSIPSNPIPLSALGRSMSLLSRSRDDTLLPLADVSAGTITGRRRTAAEIIPSRTPLLRSRSVLNDPEVIRWQS
ncbi:hypothetical protein A4X13_0g4483 [Tilletia indica]|uniref:Uncharacterized protein n=1 Tax=Tilletia indica TaxID=43049 RepID=A0A177TJ28_9BASI|nr:hypothetical protein A4X13_0g4483 [Tilletia indica]